MTDNVIRKAGATVQNVIGDISAAARSLSTKEQSQPPVDYRLHTAQLLAAFLGGLASGLLLSMICGNGKSRRKHGKKGKKKDKKKKDKKICKNEVGEELSF